MQNTALFFANNTVPEFILLNPATGNPAVSPARDTFDLYGNSPIFALDD
jgi:hypothetical protein